MDNIEINAISHSPVIRSRTNSINTPRNIITNNNNNNNGTISPRVSLTGSGGITPRGGSGLSSPLQYEVDGSDENDSISTSSSSDSEIDSEKSSPELSSRGHPAILQQINIGHNNSNNNLPSSNNNNNLTPRENSLKGSGGILKKQQTDSINNLENSKNKEDVISNFDNNEDKVNTNQTSQSPIRTNSAISHLTNSIQRTTSKFLQMDELDDYGSDDSDSEGSDQKSKNSDSVGVGIEMRELQLDQKIIDQERTQNRIIDKRRFLLTPVKHCLELSYDYLQSLFVALLGTIFCMILAYSFSVPQWIRKNNGTVNYFETQTVTYLISFFFIMGLAIFTFIQFISVYGIKRMIQTKFYIWVTAAIGLFLIVPFSMWKGGEPFWFWLGDIILLLIGYVGLCFVMGWVGKPYQTHNQRRNNGLMFLGTEVLVSATALIYGMFLIQLYSQFSNTAKIAWRLIVHPIYFEVFMMIPVRLLVTNQMEKKGVNIMHTLAVVHAQAHISTLGRMMISTINEYTLTIVSVLLLNLGKLAFRSSVHFRDRAAGMIIKKVTGTRQKETKKFVRAVGLYSEMIMENASIPASAFTMWAFYNVRGLFFFPYPSQNGQDVPFTLAEATINVAIQLAFAIVFDIITLYINERYIKLPLDRAWRKMKGKWLPFFGFLLYGVGTMGMVGIIWMACKLPRFLSCSNLDICTCKFVTDCQEFAQHKLYNNITTSSIY